MSRHRKEVRETFPLLLLIVYRTQERMLRLNEEERVSQELSAKKQRGSETDLVPSRKVSQPPLPFPAREVIAVSLL